MTHNLPAGLLNKDVEFFACANGLDAYILKSGIVVHYEDFDDATLQLFRDFLAKHPKKNKALIAMGINKPLEQIKQLIICLYGGFDHNPDVKNGELQEPEYWPCPKRGNCKQEGILCEGLKTDTGEKLTSRQVQIIKLLAAGHQDKEIAGQLNLAISTIPAHKRIIYRKTGFDRKYQLTRWATQKYLI
jgi:DNA-binding CsgD family transcriptional regulator